jgi:hypothetical protein
VRILDRLPYRETPSLQNFKEGTIEVRSYQIIVWVCLKKLLFPAVLDTGHSHNFSILERHLKNWAGAEGLKQIGEIEVNQVRVPQYEADVWIHRNRRGTREPTNEAFRLTMDQGIAVVPEGLSYAPRLPLLGLKALTRNNLKLLIDGKRREVNLKTGWF